MFTFLFPREIFAVTIYLNRWRAGYHLNLPYTDFSFPSLPDCDENVVIVRTCRYYEGPYAVVTITPRKHSQLCGFTFVFKFWRVARSLFFSVDMVSSNSKKMRKCVFQVVKVIRTFKEEENGDHNRYVIKTEIVVIW